MEVDYYINVQCMSFITQMKGNILYVQNMYDNMADVIYCHQDGNSFLFEMHDFHHETVSHYEMSYIFWCGLEVLIKHTVYV